MALFSLLIYTTLQAQSGLQDSLVARYNRNDFKGFYELGSSAWKSKNQPDGIAGWLGYMKEQTGHINHSFLNADSAKTQYFIWEGASDRTGKIGISSYFSA